MHHPTDRITHTTAFVTPIMDHWLEREIAQWVRHEGSIRQPNFCFRSQTLCVVNACINWPLAPSQPSGRTSD